MEDWPTSDPVRFTFGKERRYRFNERLGGPHSRSGRFGEEKNSLPELEFEPRIVQPVASLLSGFGGLEVACWPLVPKFAGSNPAEAVGFFRAKKSSARLPSEGK